MMRSSALQPWKWQLTGIGYSTAVQAGGAHFLLIYLLLNRTESTHRHNNNKKQKTIKHHTLGLTCAATDFGPAVMQPDVLGPNQPCKAFTP